MKLKFYAFRLAAAFLLTTGFSHFSDAQEVYFREGFPRGSASTFPTSSGSVITTPTYLKTPTGLEWYGYGVYNANTAGSSACADNGNTLAHVRLSAAATDTPYLVTPAVGTGIGEFHFLRTRTRKRFTIYSTHDVDAATATWTLLFGIPGSSYAVCGDTTLAINDPLATRIKIVGKLGEDSDVDSIWMTSVGPLPVKFAGVNVASVNGFTKVAWSIATEINTRSYVIEKSTNGSTFSSIGEVTATNAGSYSWIDNAASAAAYYRIRAIDKDGKISLSSVVRMNISNGIPTFTVAPNVVSGRSVNLQMNNIQKGSVTLNVSNNSGQIVYRNNLQNEGGAVSKSVQLPGSLNAGTYRLQLVAGTTALTQTIILQ